MAHISVDIKPISAQKKKELIDGFVKLLSETAEIPASEISISIHELPEDNMKCTSATENVDSQPKKDESKDTSKKKSFLKELFP